MEDDSVVQGQDVGHPFGMIKYELPKYSKREVVNAGKALGGDISPDDHGAIETFRIAHNWRNSHVRPMQAVRYGLTRSGRKIDPSIITVARLKRMHSIRQKLRNTPRTLYQLQDIAGCRAIVKTMSQAEQLAKVYKDGLSRHSVSRENDYISQPKPDGYRSHHIVLKFSGTSETRIYDRHRVEVQIRTQLQHSWATAVEAVGLVRDENLKANQGNSDWLRLFKLMAGEFAKLENAVDVPGLPVNRSERIDELRELEHALNGVRTLEAYSEMIKSTDALPASRYRFFIIDYDREKSTVSILPYHRQQTETSTFRYQEMERRNRSGTAVLVETDQVQSLKHAFPNYFLDVREFATHLRTICLGPKAKHLDHYSWIQAFTNRNK